MADLQTLNEGTSALYLATLKDETGAVLNGTALDSLTLTVHDTKTLQIVNSRNAQDVLNKNGVAVYATLQSLIIDGVTKTYNLSWTISPLDNVMLGSAKTENRTALFVAKWASGAKACTHKLTWTITNLALYPPA